LNKSNVVYKLKCKNCPFEYIGQTKRQLKQRIYEHQRALNNDPLISAVAIHEFNNNHVIYWVPIIISSNKYKNERLFIESNAIKNNQLNKIPLMNTDIPYIPPQYYPLMNKKFV